MKYSLPITKGETLIGINCSESHAVVDANSRFILAQKNVPFDINLQVKSVCFKCKNLEKVLDQGLIGCGFREIDFSNCPKLVSFENMAFYSSFSLSVVICPASLRFIGSHAFRMCMSLSIIKFPVDSELKVLESCAFYGTILTSFYIPMKLGNIAASAFEKIETIKNITIHKDNSIYEYSNGCLIQKSGSLLFLCVYKHMKIDFEVPNCNFIQSYTFHNSLFTKVRLPQGLVSLGYEAFSYSYLTEIDFTLCKDTLVNISLESFKSCTKLEKLDLSMCSHLAFIHNYAFADCSSLRIVYLPFAEFEIRKFVFCNCSSLKEVVFERGSGYKRVGDMSFYNTSLTSFYIGPRCFHIGTKVFHYSNISSFIIDKHNNYFTFKDDLLQLKTSNVIVMYISVHNKSACEIPQGIEIIRNACFYEAYELKELIFPNTLKIIMDEAICRTGITKLVIPESVSVFGSLCIADNYELVILEVKAKSIKIPFGFCRNCNKLKIISFAKSVKSVKEGAFLGCTQLQCVHVPDGRIKPFKSVLPQRLIYKSVCDIRDFEIIVI
jgi:hypothetical protein